MKAGLLNIVAALFLVSCGGVDSSQSYDHEGAKSEGGTRGLETPVVSGVYNIDTAETVVKWEGTTLTGNHHGVVIVTSGAITIEGGVVKFADVVIDLTTITEKDVDAEQAIKLVKLLKSPDFFNVEKYPTATIFITNVEAGAVEADFTIKGKTKSIMFPAEIVVSEKAVTVVAKLSINRTDFGIVYGSVNYFTDLSKDKIINDEINFDVSLAASK